MSIITIGEVEIHQDVNGRYSLNDLHKAAGGESKHRPSFWLRTSQAKELVLLLDSDVRICTSLEVIKGNFNDGIEQGTYAVKQLVYAYAMWVSPKFQLHVIDTFDAIVTGDYIEPKLQAEKAWFARRPLWEEIRRRALLGEPNALIAAELGKSPPSVWNAIKRMMEFGLINPAKILRFKYGSARQTVLSYMPERVVYTQAELQLAWAAEDEANGDLEGARLNRAAAAALGGAV